jgi:hypothetical protein
MQNHPSAPFLQIAAMVGSSTIIVEASFEKQKLIAARYANRHAEGSIHHGSTAQYSIMDAPQSQDNLLQMAKLWPDHNHRVLMENL